MYQRAKYEIYLQLIRLLSRHSRLELNAILTKGIGTPDETSFTSSGLHRQQTHQYLLCIMII